MIDFESPVDNITATSGASNTLTKTGKQPAWVVLKNTQGLQGSIYSASNSVDIKTKLEKEQNNQIKEENENEIECDQNVNIKRAITQAGKIRLTKGTVNRIREARKRAEMLTDSNGNNAIFQYQFEMQNKEEENWFRDLYECLNELLD